MLGTGAGIQYMLKGLVAVVVVVVAVCCVFVLQKEMLVL